MTKDEAKVVTSKLVDRYREHHKEYHHPDYNEQKTRQDFINPFFKALGWDIDNERGDSEAYREVIYEDKLDVRGRTKAPDYGFRLQGSGKSRLFYVEAKKPSIKPALKLNRESAYQLRRYGSSALAGVSILTNFEEFIVYDCSRVPSKDDSASVARLKHIRYEEYIQEFDFIYDTFSHEAVTKGRFDKFVQNEANKKGKDTLDKRFVQSLDEWRKYLAVSIARNNLKLDDEQINFAVQLTIDRLIFLRFCEDRAVEPYAQLQKAAAKGDAYKNLFALFKEADDKYNSGLFDFAKDVITPKLKVDNKVIKNIIDELYYPLCNFEFSVMPVEILGNAYEQFLGKVIRITPARSVKIEEKPEVRKAGGVYYTPQYIVDYIVNNTVGKLVEGKTPKEISALKIVDPACGSGSFLLGAFEFLLNYHINWYHQNGYATKKGKDSPFTPQRTLTTREKKRILINNIFGVDIDANAVEVTKLSLLLKCMEGETEASIQQQFTMFHERVLPDLDNNIKDGNSLIDTDFYDSQIDLGYERKIKPFSWKKAFAQVFKQGGFDAVIGNPPYVRQELLLDFKEYFESHFKVFHGMADLYSYFIERGIQLLNNKGLFGIIVANKWMRANYGEPLRKWLKQQNLYRIVDFGDLPVFQSATTYPCILLAGKPTSGNKEFEFVNVDQLQFKDLSNHLKNKIARAAKESLNDGGWNLASEDEQGLLEKLQRNGIPLGEYVKGKIYYGIKTGLNEAFVIDAETKDRLIKDDKKSEEIIKPFLAGRDIKRYQQPESDSYLIFTRRGIDIERYPAVKKYLEQFKKELMPRPKKFKGKEWPGRKPGSYKWHEIQDSIDYYQEFEKPKIIIPAIVQEGSYAWDESKFYSNDKTSIIPTTDKFLLGILNSKACNHFLKSIASTKQGGYFEYKPMYVERLPIPKANDKSEIIKHVDLLLEFNKQLATEKLPTSVEQIKTRIAHSEDRIDQLVYDLYELTPQEIKIVEGGSHE